MKLTQTPAIWLALPLTAGIMLGFQIYGLVIVLLFVACAGYFRYRSNYSKGIYNTLIKTGIAIASGMIIVGLHLIKPANSIESLVEKKLWVQGKVTSEAKPTKYGWSMAIQADSVEANGKSAKVVGEMMVFVNTSRLTCRPVPGDKVRLLGKIQALSDSSSYGKWLHQQGIKVKLNAYDFQYIRYSGSWLNNIRTTIRDLFDQNLSENNRGLATALLLGIKQDVPQEVKQAFIQTGAAHILAVSGMHVSLIFGMLSLILTPLKRLKGGNAIINLVLLLTMWVYCLLAGASPSIVRAVLTGSLVILGNAFSRKPSGLNLLSVAWVLQLALDPNVLHDLGFQLSYMAVLGILLLANPLCKANPVQNWLLRQIQQIIIVSIAAQLFTLPIILVNFGSFPTWFLLTNLLILPLASLATYAITALACLGFLPLIGTVISLVVNSLLGVMKWSMQFLAGLPGATISHLYISPAFGVLLFAIILTASVYVLSRANHRAHFSA